MRRFLKIFVCIAFCLLSARHVFSEEISSDFLDVLELELNRSMKNFTEIKESPMYYLQYTVTEERNFYLEFEDGAFKSPISSTRRFLDVDVRVGNRGLDNTHQIREGSWQDYYSPNRSVDFPIVNDSKTIQGVLWRETEYQYLKAKERYIKVLSNHNVKVSADDTSDDFSPDSVQKFQEPSQATEIDQEYWKGIIEKTGNYFTQFPFVHQSQTWLGVSDTTTYMVSSEGHRLQHRYTNIRLGFNINGMAEDGMNLNRQEIFSVLNIKHLPDEVLIQKTAQRLVGELEALIGAPLVDPYIGPAIFVNRASGVFFHEILGHRLEGHRQKSETEGQTFTAKVGQKILPEFISVYDDPTIGRWNANEDLVGSYKFDDEGSRSQRVPLIENGVLRNFLMSRSPIRNFAVSNGHGRRQRGNSIVARQGNLIVSSSKTVPFKTLREMLLEECRKQGKPYGLIFEDISGGYTMTSRGGPQVFKVLPLYVYRVYADGSPDEVVRGVDIVGTPLTSFSKIIATGDDDGVFNGVCGAESGWVPVSAVSPSILVSEVEIEKRWKEQSKPPILSPPRFDTTLQDKKDEK